MTGTGTSSCRIAIRRVIGHVVKCRTVAASCDFCVPGILHLCKCDTSRKCTEHVGTVYGAVFSAAAGRVECKHSHHGWLSENVGVAERAVPDCCTEGRAAVRGGSLTNYLAGIN